MSLRQPDDYDSTEHALFEAEKEIARLSGENAALVKGREDDKLKLQHFVDMSVAKGTEVNQLRAQLAETQLKLKEAEKKLQGIQLLPESAQAETINPAEPERLPMPRGLLR